jgi:hypothetical protein
MGFYPVTPASDIYVIGTPIFDKVSIMLENGKTFTIHSKNAAEKSIYINKVNLNGSEYSRSYINHSDIIQGGELRFEMSDKPNKGWASDKKDWPVSAVTEHLITPAPFINSDNTVFTDSMVLELGTVDKHSVIYYTTDGTDATNESEVYSKPVKIHNTTGVNFVAVNPETGKSKQMKSVFTKIPKGRQIYLHTKYANQYSAGGDQALIDGITGINDFRLGDWQGYQEVDLEAVIDLGKPTPIEELSIRFLQDINAWVFMPSEVEFYISNDDKTYIKVGHKKNTVKQDDWDRKIKDFSIKVYPKKTRYVKIIGKNIGKCPKGHKAEGYKAWIFADEITIK